MCYCHKGFISIAPDTLIHILGSLPIRFHWLQPRKTWRWMKKTLIYKCPSLSPSRKKSFLKCHLKMYENLGQLSTWWTGWVFEFTAGRLCPLFSKAEIAKQLTTVLWVFDDTPHTTFGSQIKDPSRIAQLMSLMLWILKCLHPDNLQNYSTKQRGFSTTAKYTTCRMQAGANADQRVPRNTIVYRHLIELGSGLIPGHGYYTSVLCKSPSHEGRSGLPECEGVTKSFLAPCKELWSKIQDILVAH